MTESRFDQRVEDMAARLEHRIETSADNFDKGITRKYNESVFFRSITRGLSATAAIGLLVGAARLVSRGHRTAAVWCAGLGLVALIAELLRILLLRRDT